MTHPPERAAEILRLFHAERWPIGTIARQLGIHHGTVRRVLRQSGAELAPPRVGPCLADPFAPFITETLAKYPALPASRLYRMVVERDYPGAEGHFRRLVRQRFRPQQPATAYLRVRTLPGEQGQVDWAHFGHLTVGAARRPLVAFVMVLSYSRRPYVRFYLGQATAHFLDGHVRAFAAFGGVPRVLLYDNLKSAVLERVGPAIRFNPELLAFAGHHRFEPRPVGVARGNEKGRVERAIRYVRTSFFAAREFQDLADLNAQAEAWCCGLASERPCPEDKSRSVGAVFEEEQAKLLPLPEAPFPVEARHEVSVGKTPYVRFDLNDYSVPHTLVRRTVTVFASPERVRVVAENQVVAEHARSYDKGAVIENPEHVEALVAVKRAAGAHRGIERLHHLVPEAKAFLEQVAKHGGNLGATVSGLLTAVTRHGADEVNAAVATAKASGSYHLSGVKAVLAQRRAERGEPPLAPAVVPADPRARGLLVKPHALSTYDALHREEA